MSSRVSYQSSAIPLLHSTTSEAAHSATLDSVTFANYSPRRIQACLDSTIMTYLQQQQPTQTPVGHKHKIDTQPNTSHLPSALPPLAEPTNGANTAVTRAPKVQTRREEPILDSKHSQRQGQHSSFSKLGTDHRPDEDDSEYDSEYDSEFGEETAQDDEDDYEDSELGDSDSDYESESEGDSGNEHAEAEKSKCVPERPRSIDSVAYITVDTCQRSENSVNSTRDQSTLQQVLQDPVKQITSTPDTWICPRVAPTSPAGSSGSSGGRSLQSNSSSFAREDGRCRLMAIKEETVHADTFHRQSPRPPRWSAEKTLSDTSLSGSHGSRILTQHDKRTSPKFHPSSGLSPAILPHVAKARMIPYVDDEDEDDYDEGSEDYDEDDVDEDDEEDYDEDEDFSYSEEDEDEDEEEDSSLTDNQYGARGKPGARQSTHHHSRSGYPHYRSTRLDENYLQRKAITQQVVRRSSLTALFDEATQPEIRPRNLTTHFTGSHSGMQPRHNGATARRPALSNVWTDGGATQNPSQLSESEDRAAMPDVKLTVDNLIPGQQRQILESYSALNSQEPNRPRRTDSGVEVKLSPHLQRASTSDNNSSEDRKVHRFTVSVVSSKPSSALQDTTTKAASPGSSVVIAPTHHSRTKSDGNISNQGQLPLASSSLTSTIIDGTRSVGTSSGSGSSQTRLYIKSSISCHTLPRAAGKRAGRKHVSWHHSLFPTERVLRVKPSLPSLSTVAAESAKATLSQLPSIPVMARDNVKDFHQSIRSLRALSRDEITKMSYKQQGRQELMSPIPISKSAVDSIPWWSPSRWLKHSATVDKRHWKPDSSRESCAFCFAPFHRITNPRHHCRKCGDLFCGKCASAEILMDAKNCVYVQQSQLARWSRRVDIQRHNLWIDTLPQLHPVRTAVESALVSGVSGTDGHGSVGHSGGMSNGFGSTGLRGSVGSASGSGRRGSWQLGPAAIKKSRLSIFGLFGNGPPGTASVTAGYTPNIGSDSRRGSMDLANAETVFANHYGHLQPHSQNAGAYTFSAGRRSSSSSILRSNTLSGPSHLVMSSGPHNSNEGSSTPIAMSRRMSSGGVGKICLARICVGCERELLKPVPRCTSIARYYGSLNSRNGHRRQGHGYSSLGPHAGRLHPHAHSHAGPPPGFQHPMDDIDPIVTGNHAYHSNGVRRHSPLRPTSYMAQVNGHHDNHPNDQDYYDGGPRGGREHCAGAGWNPRDEPVGPHGESRYHPSVLTFQEQQLHYTQQTQGPLCREMC